MSIERIDWVKKLMASAGIKTWTEYCEKIGLEYHPFMSRISEGHITERMAEAMGKFHGMDLSFLINDDQKSLCTRNTNTRETTSKK